MAPWYAMGYVAEGNEWANHACKSAGKLLLVTGSHINA